MAVGKRVIEVGRVRVRNRVRKREIIVDEPLSLIDMDVERVTVGRYVDSMPSVRTERGTVIVPVVEEVLVTEKRLLLKAEVRIARREERVRKPKRVELRSTEPVVERIRSRQRPPTRAR